MHLATLKTIGTLVLLLVAVVLSAKFFGPLAVEVGQSASKQLYTTASTDSKSAKADDLRKPRYYRVITGPDGPTLVPQ